MEGEHKSEATLIGCAVVCGILLVGALYIGTREHLPEPVDERIVAQTMAEKFVTGRLLTPGTAKFSPFDETEIAWVETHKVWVVAGWVDSQNSFGALLRKRYRVTLRKIAAREWEAPEVLILDR